MPYDSMIYTGVIYTFIYIYIYILLALARCALLFLKQSQNSVVDANIGDLYVMNNEQMQMDNVTLHVMKMNIIHRKTRRICISNKSFLIYIHIDVNNHYKCDYVCRKFHSDWLNC